MPTPDQLQETLVQEPRNAEEFRAKARAARKACDYEAAREHAEAAEYAERQAEKAGRDLTAMMLQEAG